MLARIQAVFRHVIDNGAVLYDEKIGKLKWIYWITISIVLLALFWLIPAALIYGVTYTENDDEEQIGGLNYFESIYFTMGTCYITLNPPDVWK